ncbi:hypothetical protein SAMN05444354_116137 [Stigmatella aurantiaca]|uniref:Lipoprotein n=2 Tax=Stigmatella aurantiaca TaxID=41 RepID=A0A1H7Y8S6_STIAU|nr:hypothetical protein SAMN05444354_116137 [Stigmatella aurantiaca]
MGKGKDMRSENGAWKALPLLLAMGVTACGGGAGNEQAPSTQAALAQEASGPGTWNGPLKWAQHLNGPDDNNGSIVSDRDGGFLALLNFVGSIDLGTGRLVAPGGPTSNAMALARYDVHGHLKWSKVFGAQSPEGTAFGLRHAVDRQRDIILFVEANDVDFGGGALPFGRYLVKLDSQGRLRWSRPIDTSRGYAGVNRIVTGRDNTIALAGELAGTVDFGGGPVSSRQLPEGGQTTSAFLTKFSPTGTNLWTFVDVEHQSQGFGATVDSEGNLVLCGTVFAEVHTEPFVLMLSPEGQVRWSRRLEGALGFAFSVATHGNRVVAVGTFAQSFTFAGHTHTAVPNGGIEQDAFIVAFTRQGEQRWAWNFGFSIEDVAMDEKDGVTVSGSYEAGSGDLGVLGSLPGNPETLANVYVAKFDRVHGKPLWTRGFTASGADTGSPGLESASIAVTKDGRSAILGQFTQRLTVGSEHWQAEGRSDFFLLGFDR